MLQFSEFMFIFCMGFAKVCDYVQRGILFSCLSELILKSLCGCLFFCYAFFMGGVVSIVLLSAQYHVFFLGTFASEFGLSKDPLRSDL